MKTMREKVARLIEFSMPFVDNEGDQIGTDGKRIFLLSEGPIQTIEFEDAVMWVMNEILTKVSNEEVVEVSGVFVITRKYARRWGLVVPDELEFRPDTKFVLVDEEIRELLNGSPEQLLKSLTKNGVEVYYED